MYKANVAIKLLCQRVCVCLVACVCMCACVCTCVCRGKKYIGTIHQLSTCNQRFGGLMTVRFNDHRPPSIPDGTLSYQKRGGCDIDKDTMI